MAASKGSAGPEALPDGSFDWSGGVDSGKVTTLQSTLNPNGLARNQLAWLNNATVRDGGIRQITGWQPLRRVLDSGRWQGGFIYEPDSALPYLVCSISGIIYSVQLVAPFTILDLSGGNVLLRNPPDAEIAFFVQAENFLVIQAGDFFTGPAATTINAYGQPLVTPSTTLPLFWDGTTLRRSRGITNLAPGGFTNGINEIPAATEMDYYGGRIWYAQARQFSGGDMVGGPSGTAANHFRDAVLNITENPLVLGGDGFTLPTNAGNIRAIKHSASLNASLGQGQLYIFTRKVVYMMTVPVTRIDWINASAQNQPQLTVVQLVNGTVGGRTVVPVNGDLFYQSFDPAIRSLIMATRFFSEYGNTAISQNETRALQLNDRGLMRFSSGMQWDNRIWQLVLPQEAADGVNVIHKAVLPLDFDIVTNLSERKPPVWEGAYDGLQFLEIFNGDFGGLPRGFAAVISEIDGSINIWELTTFSRTWNGDNRVTWALESPSFTWQTSGLEFKLKQLYGGECWIDKVFGTVDMDVFYREDADPCWRFWFHTEFCAGRNCEEHDPVLTCYPDQTFREGYRYPVVFPQPPVACDSMGVRPTTVGYQFQVKILFKGWCRVRGLILYALPREKPQFDGVACPPAVSIPQGMRRLPTIPAVASTPVVPPTPPPPPPPPLVLPGKATSPSPSNGATSITRAGTTLSWASGGNTSSYNVYFNGVFQGNQGGTTFVTPALLGITTYTWRIDSVNADGTTMGDVWSFTTDLHATVSNWAARVVTNGGASPSTPTQSALSTFCDTLDSKALTALMHDVNCLVPDGLVAATTPLILSLGSDPWTNHGPFVAGDLTVNGLKGNGSTKFLDTGIIPFGTITYANFGVTIYNSEAGGGANEDDFGSDSTNPNYADNTTALSLLFAGNMFWDCTFLITGFGRITTASPGQGYYSCNRTGLTTNKVFFANSGTAHGQLSVTNTSDMTGLDTTNRPLYAFAFNYGGVTTSPTSRRHSFIAVHQGLTQAQSLDFFNAIQALRTTLGGGHV